MYFSLRLPHVALTELVIGSRMRAVEYSLLALGKGERH